MTLREFVATIRTSWMLLVFFTAGGLVAAAAVSMLTPTSYGARTELYVSVTPGSTVTLSPLEAVSSFARIATSATVLDAVIDELELEQSVDELAESVTASGQAGTAVLTITAEHPSPHQAAAIANSVADGTTRLANRLEKASTAGTRFTISTITRATPPARSTGAGLGVTLGFGMLLGLGVGALAALGREALSRPLSAPAEAASPPSR